MYACVCFSHIVHRVLGTLCFRIIMLIMMLFFLYAFPDYESFEHNTLLLKVKSDDCLHIDLLPQSHIHTHPHACTHTHTRTHTLRDYLDIWKCTGEVLSLEKMNFRGNLKVGSREDWLLM